MRKGFMTITRSPSPTVNPTQVWGFERERKKEFSTEAFRFTCWWKRFYRDHILEKNRLTKKRCTKILIENQFFAVFGGDHSDPMEYILTIVTYHSLITKLQPTVSSELSHIIFEQRNIHSYLNSCIHVSTPNFTYLHPSPSFLPTFLSLLSLWEFMC